MSTVSNVNAFAPAGQQREITNKNGELGKEAFLRLLVAQLQNQDPLSPSEDKEFIAQLSTFSMLEQMQNMSASMSASQAAALIGKQVTWEEVVNGQHRVFYATVESVRVDGTNVYLVVDHQTGKEIQYSQVKLIEDPNTSSSAQLSHAANLIGKNVNWYEMNSSNEPVLMTAKATSVSALNGVIYVGVGKDGSGNEKLIPLSNITAVGDVAGS